MILIARQLLSDPLRTLLTIAAMAAVVAVILILEGFNAGLLAQMRNTVMGRQGDLIVSQAGVSNMIAARSILPQYVRADIEKVPGVAEAHPLTGIPLIYEEGTSRTPFFMFVYDTKGGPNQIVEGKISTDERSLVIDKALAEKYNLVPGDPFVVSDFEFRVSGISRNSAAFFTSFAFAKYDDLIDFYFDSDLAADFSSLPLLSFLLIELDAGVDLDTVANQIEVVSPEVDVFKPEELAGKDESLGRDLFGSVINLLVGVSYLIGALVSGIIMFAVVSDRRLEFGVLKALGFGFGYLSMLVMGEAIALTLLAVPAGFAMAVVSGYIIESLMPLYLMDIAVPSTIVRTAIICLIFTVIGSFMPVQLIRRLDPDMVFRS